MHPCALTHVSFNMKITDEDYLQVSCQISSYKKTYYHCLCNKAMDKMILPLPLPTTKILHEKNVSRILASFCKIPSKHTTLFQRQCLRCWRPNNVVCLLSIIDLHIFRFTLSVEKSKRRMLRVRHFLMKGTEQFIFVALGDVVLLGSFVYEYTFFRFL